MRGIFHCVIVPLSTIAIRILTTGVMPNFISLVLLIGACCFLITACAQLVGDSDIYSQWLAFQEKYNRHYDSYAEEARRYAIFVARLEYVRLHNLANDAGLNSFRVEINQFADQTAEEVMGTHGGMHRTMADGNSYNDSTAQQQVVGDTLQATKDWRRDNIVTDVKNQTQCGSCWAFTAVGAMEAHHNKAHKVKITLSEQQLVDCSHEKPNEGCNGGMLVPSFKYVMDNGIAAEAAYQYEAAAKSCRASADQVAAKCTGYIELKQGIPSETFIICLPAQISFVHQLEL